MTGHLVQGYPGSWSIVLHLGYQTDPATGTTEARPEVDHGAWPAAGR
jgi:hypothetical protein